MLRRRADARLRSKRGGLMTTVAVLAEAAKVGAGEAVTFWILAPIALVGAVGMVQIIVYTGAIIMLFLFVLMLVGRDSSDALIETLRGQRTAAIVLGVGF